MFALLIIAQFELLPKIIENGIIAGAFLYILYWLLNKQSQIAVENSKRAQLTNIEVAQAIRGLVNIVMGMQQQLLTHDLTMTGLNPEHGGTVETRDTMAYKKYVDVMETLEEQRSLIRQMNEAAEARIDRLR